MTFTSCKKTSTSSTSTTDSTSAYPISQCKISKVTRPEAFGHNFVYTFTYDSLGRVVYISESELNYTFSFIYYGNYVVRTVKDTGIIEVDSFHLNSFGLIDTEMSNARGVSRLKYTMYYDVGGKIQKMNTWINATVNHDVDFTWDGANLRYTNFGDTFSYTPTPIQPGDYFLWRDLINFGGYRVKNTNLVSVLYPVDGPNPLGEEGGSSIGYCKYHFDKGGKITSVAVTLDYNSTGTMISADSLVYEYICK
jgi:hypothetical protein